MSNGSNDDSGAVDAFGGAAETGPAATVDGAPGTGPADAVDGVAGTVPVATVNCPAGTVFATDCSTSARFGAERSLSLQHLQLL